MRFSAHRSMVRFLVLWIWFLFGTAFYCFSQQDPIWSMSMFNRAYINPAFAGYHGALNVTFVGRSQWVGIDGAPNTFAATATAPSKFLHGGIGVSLMGDVIGPFRTTEVKGMYAYKMNFGKGVSRSSLSIGINGGLFSKSLDGTSWRPPDGQPINDNALINLVVNQSALDLGAGIAYIGPNQRYYLGLSAAHLTEPTLTNFTRDQGQEQSSLFRSYTVTGGYKLYLDRRGNSVIEPSIIYRRTGSQGQIDINVNVDVNPVIFGLSVRPNDAMVAILGFHASERLFVAYSYDYTTAKFSSQVSGSHEIVLSYTLPAVIRLTPPNFGVRDKRNLR